jgi:hypothetical protein
MYGNRPASHLERHFRPSTPQFAKNSTPSAGFAHLNAFAQKVGTLHKKFVLVVTPLCFS